MVLAFRMVHDCFIESVPKRYSLKEHRDERVNHPKSDTMGKFHPNR